MTYTREDLTTAELHVAEGEKHVARQKQIVERLAGDPRLHQIAQRLLNEMETALSAHRQHREAILAQLSSPGLD